MEQNTIRARLYCDRDLTESELHAVAVGQAAVYTAPAPHHDASNQDALAVSPVGDQSGVLVVADGVGGLPTGARASATAVASIESSIRQALEHGNHLRGAIIDGIEKANHEVMALGTGSATTVAIVEIQGNTVRPYHVGDSQIMVFGQRGKIKLLTKSHSPVGYALEAGFLNEQEAMYHEKRHEISNAIGSVEMQIEVGSPLELAVRDTVLIASDGLYDNLYVEEIVETCRKGPLGRSGMELVERCRRRMSGEREGRPSKPDDLTFVLYRGAAKKRPSISSPIGSG